jgi:hypothetical protein
VFLRTDFDGEGGHHLPTVGDGMGDNEERGAEGLFLWILLSKAHKIMLY